jgi:hypothetical protein
MTRPQAADDFATIRARMKELRLVRERAEAAESEWEGDPPTHRARSVRRPPPEISEGPGRVHQRGSGTPLDRDRAWSAWRG